MAARKTRLMHASRLTPEEREELYRQTLGFVPPSSAELVQALRVLLSRDGKLMGPREMGHLTGVSHQQIGNIYRGAVEPGPSVLRRLFKAMEEAQITSDQLREQMGLDREPRGLPPEQEAWVEEQVDAAVARMATQQGRATRLMVLNLVENWPEEDLQTLYRRVLGLQNGRTHG